MSVEKKVFIGRIQPINIEVERPEGIGDSHTNVSGALRRYLETSTATKADRELLDGEVERVRTLWKWAVMTPPSVDKP